MNVAPAPIDSAREMQAAGRSGGTHHASVAQGPAAEGQRCDSREWLARLLAPAAPTTPFVDAFRAVHPVCAHKHLGGLACACAAPRTRTHRTQTAPAVRAAPATPAAHTAPAKPPKPAEPAACACAITATPTTRTCAAARRPPARARRLHVLPRRRGR
eukprot:2510163-Prymnesium_polylepis.2